MAVTNTGIVERVITGVNDGSELFPDNTTSTATNTGVSERSIVGVHDANFVHPLGDELISNGGFSNGSTDWTFGTGWSVAEDKVIATNVSSNTTQDLSSIDANKSYKISFNINNYSSGNFFITFGGNDNTINFNSNGDYTVYINPLNAVNNRFYLRGNSFTGSIDNVSVKEVLVNRESTINNTGVVERPITGVNESEALFPDNTDSTVVNISGTIVPLLNALEARATTFENRECTQNILINLEKC